jgi:hypothetical protein
MKAVNYGRLLLGLSDFNNDLFKSQYPNIEFVNPGALVSNLYG